MSYELRKGFTLLELLIVVSIIGVLVSLLMTNFIGVRQRARDAQRKSDLRQIQSALELYRTDIGSYPIGSTLANCPSGSPTMIGNAPTCTATYMQKIPKDPQGANYTYNSVSGTSYTITTCLENGNDSQKDSPNVAPCNGTTTFSYTLTNP